MFTNDQTFTVSCNSEKELTAVIQLALEMYGEIGKPAHAWSYYTDDDGYLIVCAHHSLDSMEEKLYPFPANATMIAEHIKWYTDNMSQNEIENLIGYAPKGNVTAKVGWEIFNKNYAGVYPYNANIIIGAIPHWVTI